MKLPNFKFYGRCGHEAKFWFVPHVSKYFVTCARQRDLLNQTCIHMIQKIENRRVTQENIIVIMNISFHHPSIGYFLQSYISWSSGKIFPLKWSLVNVQQKKTNKNGQKSEKKKQKVNIEKAVSLSNKTSWNFSTFPPNFRSFSFAPGTDWSHNSFLIVFSLLILLAWKWPENSSTCLVF